VIYTYQHEGQTYTINLERQPDGSYRALIDGRTLTAQVRPLPAGGWRLIVDGQAHTAHAAAQADRRYVQVDNRVYSLNVPGTGRRRATAGSGDLTAPMPGQVTAVLVQIGDQVERGQTLLVMEAMKMEMRVAAPTAGTVKRLLVEPGAVVERGQLLAEVEAVP
jgi:3-methylcrotonyl-CoA carboxylase alpha subunit